MSVHRAPSTPATDLEMIPIPEGWFAMGHSTALDCEQPVHRVWVDSFKLAARQVSNAHYLSFTEATGHSKPPFWNDANFSDLAQPVVGVSWLDAAAYCDWLTSTTRGVFRLPSEAEWERAARGGLEGALFPWGDQPPETRPQYLARWLRGPESVGTGNRNGFGLFDMCENVHEWCIDWFDADYYRRSPERNPQGPETGLRRASRGGSWRHHIKISRCHTRSSIPPEFHYADYGFRVACSTVGGP